MKNSLWAALLLVAIIGGYYFASGRSAYVVDSRADEAQPQKQVVANSRLSDDLRNQGGNSSSVNLQRNRIVDVIADQIAKKGAASPEVADMVTFSQGACATISEKQRKGIKATDWANAYLTSACEGFDATQYRGLKSPGPDFLKINVESGQQASAEAALTYLKRPDSLIAAMAAGMVLMNNQDLPGQESFGLSEEQLTRAFVAANASVMCPGRNGCVAAPMLAAATCLESQCQRGTTYEDALRQNLSNSELRAMNELRTWLRSIRK